MDLIKKMKFYYSSFAVNCLIFLLLLFSSCNFYSPDPVTDDQIQTQEDITGPNKCNYYQRGRLMDWESFFNVPLCYAVPH